MTQRQRDVLLAKRTAERLVALGFNPLPSRADAKRPALNRFAHLFHEPISPAILENWQTPNIQVCCGTYWRLLVVDLDGPAAIDEWARWCQRNGGFPHTWTVRTGSGGLHCWLKAPGWLDSAPKRTCWYDPTFVPGERSDGRIERQAKIELLGDGSLAIAPPSRHTKTGHRYRFVPGRSPREIPLPAMAPDWVLDLPFAVAPGHERPKRQPPAELVRVEPERIAGGERIHYLRTDVHAAMSDQDRIDTVVRWGLKFSTYTSNASGWMACHAVCPPSRPGRATYDANPSASFKPATGAYWDAHTQETLSIYDLGVMLRPYEFHDWTEVRDFLGSKYHARSAKQSWQLNKERKLA